jgi:hypothetical protein
MKVHDDQTQAMQAVLHHWIRGKRYWIRFEIEQEKMQRKADEWADNFGTRLPPWKRQDRHQGKKPTASAVCGRVVGHPNKRELILMATPYVLTAPAESPWTREAWCDRLPEFGYYVMVRELNNQRKATWTWRLRDSVYERLSRYMTSIVKERNAVAIRAECEAWTKYYPYFGGVRRQFQRLLRSAIKLWTNLNRAPWPGLSVDELPMLVGFRGDRLALQGNTKVERSALSA